MLGLTSLGIIHTIISLAAVSAGVVSLIRDGRISWGTSVGKYYVVTTIIVCLTGFGIFQHGGFGKPHAFGIITLIVLGVIYMASKNSTLFGRINPYVIVVSYSMTFFFHVIPGITETATRLPIGAPLASSPEDPLIQKAVGICFILFVIGATLQVIRLRKTLQTE